MKTVWAVFERIEVIQNGNHAGRCNAMFGLPREPGENTFTYIFCKALYSRYGWGQPLDFFLVQFFTLVGHLWHRLYGVGLLSIIFFAASLARAGQLDIWVFDCLFISSGTWVYNVSSRTLDAFQRKVFFFPYYCYYTMFPLCISM